MAMPVKGAAEAPLLLSLRSAATTADAPSCWLTLLPDQFKATREEELACLSPISATSRR